MDLLRGLMTIFMLKGYKLEFSSYNFTSNFMLKANIIDNSFHVEIAETWVSAFTPFYILSGKTE